MKIDALFMTEKRKAEVRQVEIAPPSAGEVQIEVKACGVCAWDCYLFKGISTKQDFPFQFGHEAAGIIREVGPGVTGLAVGDRVFSIDGTVEMAQRMNIPAEFVAKIPAHLEKAEDFVPYIGEPAVCVVSGMANIDFQPGDNVVIIGVGYMGLLNVQAFRNSLIGRLICFGGHDEKKLALAKKYGADECYLSDSEEGKAAMQRIIDEGGADIVVECSSTQKGLQMATDLVRTGGTISNFAWHRAERTLDASPWHLRGLRIINTAPSVDRHFADHVPQTARLMNRGVFDQSEMITHVMDYHEIQRMLEIAEGKQDGYIKGVITF